MTDYEKKYKEMKARVLEIGRGYVKGVDFSKPRQIAEYIDPDLKESEDEKIRKDIMAAVETYGSFTQGRKEEIYTWLKNQGEQKPVERSLPYRKNETAEKLIALAECLELDGDCLFNGLSGDDYGKFLRVLAKELTEIKPDRWSEEDEKKIMWLIRLISTVGFRELDNDKMPCRRIELLDWLKALKDRVQPQPKQEWSEEDERLLSKLQLYVDMECFDRECNGDDLLNWLKSLKPQNRWKPSKEQMYMLEWLTTNVLDDGVVEKKAKEVLSTLIEQLKSL